MKLTAKRHQHQPMYNSTNRRPNGTVICNCRCGKVGVKRAERDRWMWVDHYVEAQP